MHGFDHQIEETLERRELHCNHGLRGKFITVLIIAVKKSLEATSLYLFCSVFHFFHIPEWPTHSIHINKSPK